ncbi:MAG: hypothetical protein OXN44_04725 [Acidimicrobiaceae bacterium]|nr:hypothetical protein [Acidimicrobiaceae bacterium]MDE0605648.1 hypothetical protein [Acidimicrobiaceae bacterium]
MKVTVSIPDPLFAEAERLVQRRRWSRSHLYAQALAMLMEHEDDGETTERLDAVYRDQKPRVDTGLLNAQAHAVREEW